MKKVIVVSAVNFVSGGPLSILKECLAELSANYAHQYEIIALVHSKNLLTYRNVTFLEFPLSKKSWLLRLYYEYVGFYFLSKKLRPDFWLSLHDMTPNVVCKNRFVYCHNPAPFYASKKNDWYKNTKTYLFSKFYKYLYGLNIRKNRYVIVQQSWLREFFSQTWGLQNVVVAYPEVAKVRGLFDEKGKSGISSSSKLIFYPSFPRPFKNFELICEAVANMSADSRERIAIILTLERKLNNYASEIFDKYGHINEISFKGLLAREKVYEYYKLADALIFPSRLETWGLPITEFKSTGKPIFLADLPYARETIGAYEKVSFFDPNSVEDLRDLLEAFVNETIDYEGNAEVMVTNPHTKGWKSLFNLILDDGKKVA